MNETGQTPSAATRLLVDPKYLCTWLACNQTAPARPVARRSLPP